MEDAFISSRGYINKSAREKLAVQMGISQQRVSTWFYVCLITFSIYTDFCLIAPLLPLFCSHVVPSGKKKTIPKTYQHAQKVLAKSHLIQSILLNLYL